MLLDWKSDESFVVDGVDYSCGSLFAKLPSSTENRFRIVKPRHHIEQYQRLIHDHRPQRIVELGIFDGGSTALLTQLAAPEKLIAIDLMTDPCDALEKFLDHRGYRDKVATYYGVDQADTARLGAILDHECADAPLDLVIDDASHALEPTRASFNFLFPRLAPGGAYVIEDWSGDLFALPYGLVPSGRDITRAKPITLLMFELLLVSAYRPLAVASVEVGRGWAVIRRGPKDLDPQSFEISTSYGDFGRTIIESINIAESSTLVDAAEV